MRREFFCVRSDLQLDGGAAEEEGTSSSASRERLRLRPGAAPRFAADMLGRNGELEEVRLCSSNVAIPKRPEVWDVQKHTSLTDANVRDALYMEACG